VRKLRYHAILLLLLILGTLVRYDVKCNAIAYKKYTQSQKLQKIECNIIDKIVARNKKIEGTTRYGKYYVQGTVSPELVLYDQWIYSDTSSLVEDIEDYGSFVAVGESIWQHGGFAVELYYKSDFSLYARKELSFNFIHSRLYDIATYSGYIYVTGVCWNDSKYACITKLDAGLNVIWDLFKKSCIGTSMVFVQKDAYTYVYVIAEIVGKDGFALIIIDTETGTIHDYQEYSIYDFKPRSAFMLDGYIYIFGSGSYTAAIRMDPITYEYEAIRWSKKYTYATQHNGVIYTVDNYDLLRKEQHWSRNLTELLGGDKAHITSITFGDFGSIYATVELGGGVLKIIRIDDEDGEILSQLTISREENWEINAGAGIIVTGLNQQYQSRIFEIDTVENPEGTTTYVRYILSYEDIIPPTVSILNPNNDTYIYDTVDISYSATDNESGIDHYEVRLDGGDWIDKGTTTSHTFSNLTEGEHWIYVKAVDKTGNDKIAKVRIYADQTNPSLVLYSPSNNSYTNETNITVTWTGSDNYGIDHYEVRLDGGDWIDKGTTTSHTFSNLTEGEHWIYVKAVDYAGNKQTITLKVTVDIVTDQYEPYLGSGEWASGIWGANNETSAAWSDLIYGTYLSGKVTIRISLTDDYAVDEDRISIALYANGVPIQGVLGYQYDSVIGKLYVWIDTQGIEDGTTCTLRVTAYDKAGNRNYQDYVFVVDNAYPLFRKFELDGQGYIGADGSYYYGGDYPTIIVTVNITDSADNLWNVSVKLGNEEIVFFYWNADHWDYTYNSTLVTQINVYGNRSSIKFDINIDATKLVDGAYQLRIIARDDAGYSSEATKDITIDWTPPTIYEFYGVPQDPTIDNGVWDNYSVIDGQWNITYNISDGTAEINIYVNESGAWKYLVQLSSNVWDTTDPQFRNGIFKVELVAKDPLGNTNIMYYIIAVENDRPYPWMYINGTRLGINTVTVGGELDTLLAIELAPGQGWPTGLKQYIVYIDDSVLYNVAFDGWRGWYEKWYNISFILNETLLTPGLHDIKICVWGMATWTYLTVVYQINYKPRVKITLLNETVYWGHVDLWFNVTDVVGRTLDGQLNVTLNGTLYTLNVVDGFAVLSVYVAPPSTYILNTSYAGDGLDTVAVFDLTVLKHPLTYNYAISKIAVNRSYSINLTSILDALDYTQPSGVLWFEIYWSYTLSGPWFSLHNVTYNGTAIMIYDAWVIDDLNNDGVIDDADSTVYIKIVVAGWYEAENILVQKGLLRGSINVMLENTTFYWGDIALNILVDDTLDIDENGYVVVTFNDTNYTVDIVAGSGVWTVSIYYPGNYSVVVTYHGQVEVIKREFVLEVLKHPLSMVIYIDNTIYVGQELEITFSAIADTVTGISPDEELSLAIYYTWNESVGLWIQYTNFSFYGSSYVFSGIWDINDINGDGIITAEDNYVYLKIVATGSHYEYYKVLGPITVKHLPEISMTTTDTLVYTDTAAFTIDTNVPLATIYVYYFDSESGWVLNATALADEDGDAIVRLYVPDAGTVKYKVVTNETEYFQQGEEVFEFEAIAETVTISVLDTGTWVWSDDVIITLYVRDDEGNPATGVEVQLEIRNSIGTIIVGQGASNATGHIAILTTCTLPAGTYTMYAVIISDKYTGDEITFTISVAKEKATINATIQEGWLLVVTVYGDENDTLAGIPVIIYSNGTTVYTGRTDWRGQILFDVSEYAGQKLRIVIPENDYCEEAETEIEVPNMRQVEQYKWIIVFATLGIILFAVRRRSREEEIGEFYEGEGEITLERTNSNTYYYSGDNIWPELQ